MVVVVVSDQMLGMFSSGSDPLSDSSSSRKGRLFGLLGGTESVEMDVMVESWLDGSDENGSSALPGLYCVLLVVGNGWTAKLPVFRMPQYGASSAKPWYRGMPSESPDGCCCDCSATALDTELRK